MDGWMEAQKVGKITAKLFYEIKSCAKWNLRPHKSAKVAGRSPDKETPSIQSIIRPSTYIQPHGLVLAGISKTKIEAQPFLSKKQEFGGGRFPLKQDS